MANNAQSYIRLMI